MIEFINVTKRYPVRGGYNTVLDSVSFVIGRHEKLGIMGRNGAGKSTSVRLLSGSELPTSGQIRRRMSVSWPLAFGGAFQSSLTGRDNIKFICRIYGVDYATAFDFVAEFSELGRYLKEPVKTYSSGMSARLAFAISMVVNFDCFLIDEVVSVGDSRFHEKCHHELFEKRKEHAFVIVSHDPSYVREHCDRVIVLSRGRMTHFDDVEQGIELYLRGDSS